MVIYRALQQVLWYTQHARGAINFLNGRQTQHSSSLSSVGNVEKKSDDKSNKMVGKTFQKTEFLRKEKEEENGIGSRR